MAKLIITRGLPGCGKTTRARELIDSSPGGELFRLNRDDLRRMALRSGYRTPEHGPETTITLVRDTALAALLSGGRSVVCDDCNLRGRYVRDLMAIADRAGAEVEIWDMTGVAVEVCVERDRLRSGAERVGEDVIRGMHTRWVAQHHGRPLPVPVLTHPQQPTVEPYVAPVGAPRAFLVDLDGTLALLNGRDPYDETMVSEDLPNWPVIETARSLTHSMMHPVFMSGRTDACRDATLDWILKYMFGMVRAQWANDPIDLYMRASGDTRPDHVVKLELFDRHVREQYAVALVIDDRASVVRMWRSLGLTVLQCADGDF